MNVIYIRNNMLKIVKQYFSLINEQAKQMKSDKQKNGSNK